MHFHYWLEHASKNIYHGWTGQKTWWETSFKRNLVSDSKKEVMNEVKAILSEKDKKTEVLKSHVNLLQNHV